MNEMDEYELVLADWLLRLAIPNGDCLECHYSKATHGYCKMAGNEFAHRFVYRIKCGPINGLWVLHTCDNRCCINPKHLWLGTNTENSKDRDMKGRLSREGRPREVSNANVLKILELRKSGLTYERIAAQFLVSAGTVRNILARPENAR